MPMPADLLHADAMRWIGERMQDGHTAVCLARPRICYMATQLPQGADSVFPTHDDIDMCFKPDRKIEY